jgi:hypothetical protein
MDDLGEAFVQYLVFVVLFVLTLALYNSYISRNRAISKFVGTAS